jgi:hypothetical protein
MTPKEKAKELIEKFCEYSHTDYNPTRGGYQFESQIANAKQCALIAVGELINVTSGIKGWIDGFQYWEAVKQEIITYGGNK